MGPLGNPMLKEGEGVLVLFSILCYGKCPTMEILPSAPEVQNRNVNFSLMAIVFNRAPCRPVGPGQEGQHLQGMGRAGVLLLPRRGVKCFCAPVPS